MKRPWFALTILFGWMLAMLGAARQADADYPIRLVGIEVVIPEKAADNVADDDDLAGCDINACELAADEDPLVEPITLPEEGGWFVVDDDADAEPATEEVVAASEEPAEEQHAYDYEDYGYYGDEFYYDDGYGYDQEVQEPSEDAAEVSETVDSTEEAATTLEEAEETADETDYDYEGYEYGYDSYGYEYDEEADETSSIEEAPAADVDETTAEATEEEPDWVYNETEYYYGDEDYDYEAEDYDYSSEYDSAYDDEVYGEVYGAEVIKSADTADESQESGWVEDCPPCHGPCHGGYCTIDGRCFDAEGNEICRPETEASEVIVEETASVDEDPAPPMPEEAETHPVDDLAWADEDEAACEQACEEAYQAYSSEYGSDYAEAYYRSLQDEAADAAAAAADEIVVPFAPEEAETTAVEEPADTPEGEETAEIDGPGATAKAIAAIKDSFRNQAIILGETVDVMTAAVQQTLERMNGSAQ